jgi:hypothetical protein
MDFTIEAVYLGLTTGFTAEDRCLHFAMAGCGDGVSFI